MKSIILFFVLFWVCIVGAFISLYYSQLDWKSYLGMGLFLVAGGLREYILFAVGAWKRTEDETIPPNDINGHTA